MNERKICPLLTLRPSVPEKRVKCIEDRCAWWNNERDECLIATAALSLDNLDEKGITIFQA